MTDYERRENYWGYQEKSTQNRGVGQGNYRVDGPSGRKVKGRKQRCAVLLITAARIPFSPSSQLWPAHFQTGHRLSGAFSPPTSYNSHPKSDHYIQRSL